MIWWLLGGALPALALLLWAAGRRHEGKTAREWDMVLTGRAARKYQEVAEGHRATVELADITYRGALTARQLGSMEEAHRLLEAGCGLIQHHCPSMARSLAAMGVLSRMVTAMAPVRPLKPADFRVGQLANMAHLQRFLHYFLVSAGERFRLRVTVLGRGFRLLGVLVAQATARARHAPAASEGWADVEAIRQDVHTLTDETIESFRILVTSFDAERREPPPLP